jgi:hypothetical protein
MLRYAEIYKVYNHIYACKSSINLIYSGYFSAMEAMSHPIEEKQFTLWQTFT